MKPATSVAIDAALRNLGELAGGEAELLKTMSPLSILAFLLRIIGRDWDDAAASRVEEIKAVSDLLRRGAELAPESLRKSIGASLAQAKQGSDNLRISALTTTLDSLRAVLIELHAWLESASSPEAKALLRDVWSLLERSARRRAVDIPWF